MFIGDPARLHISGQVMAMSCTCTMQSTCRGSGQTGQSTVHTYIHARYFEGVCCSKNLSLNRVADDTEPAQGARPDWLGKGERPLPLHLQCRKDGGAPGQIVGPRHVGLWPHDSIPSIALTSVHLVFAH